MSHICTHFQTYRNSKATEFVLENFREHYPNAPLMMFSDAGSNFSNLAKKYNCNYQHRFINLGRQGHQKIKLESDYPTNPNYSSLQKSLLKY